MRGSRRLGVGDSEVDGVWIVHYLAIKSSKIEVRRGFAGLWVTGVRIVQGGSDDALRRVVEGILVYERVERHGGHVRNAQERRGRRRKGGDDDSKDPGIARAFILWGGVD